MTLRAYPAERSIHTGDPHCARNDSRQVREQYALCFICPTLLILRYAFSKNALDVCSFQQVVFLASVPQFYFIVCDGCNVAMPDACIIHLNIDLFSDVLRLQVLWLNDNLPLAHSCRYGLNFISNTSNRFNPPGVLTSTFSATCLPKTALPIGDLTEILPSSMSASSSETSVYSTT